MDWQRTLAQLEATLTQLNAQGVRYLSIAQDPALANDLREGFGAGGLANRRGNEYR